jgi:hypothetical protein
VLFDIAALEHGMARLRDGFPLSNRLIREMHEKLRARGRGSEKQPGESDDRRTGSAGPGRGTRTSYLRRLRWSMS